MLKRWQQYLIPLGYEPAAFGRLCVETEVAAAQGISKEPAAFGRLCVETHIVLLLLVNLKQPPSGGCVLKLFPTL